MLSVAYAANATDFKGGLTIWFDRPTTLANKAIWWGHTPEMWKGENKPESAGDTAQKMLSGNLNLYPLEMAVWVQILWVLLKLNASHSMKKPYGVVVQIRQLALMPIGMLTNSRHII